RFVVARFELAGAKAERRHLLYRLLGSGSGFRCEFPFRLGICAYGLGERFGFGRHASRVLSHFLCACLGFRRQVSVARGFGPSGNGCSVSSDSFDIGLGQGCALRGKFGFGGFARCGLRLGGGVLGRLVGVLEAFGGFLDFGEKIGQILLSFGLCRGRLLGGLFFLHKDLFRGGVGVGRFREAFRLLLLFGFGRFEGLFAILDVAFGNRQRAPGFGSQFIGITVPLQFRDLLSILRIPKADYLVRSCGGKALAVRPDRNRSHRRLVFQLL